jgi:hypothetical protein
LHETLSQKPITKDWAGGVAQGIGPEFKPQYHKTKLIGVFLYKKIDCT